jgi:type III secretion protein J
MKNAQRSRILTLALALFGLLFTLTSCESNNSIVNNVDEREANEIIVFLASQGIHAGKTPAVEAAAGATGPSNQWNITVDSKDSVQAMAVLNQNGLPRRQGSTLLELFAKSGLMSSDKEESIRFQSGLAEQLKNTIRKIDGVIDADVQISFPQDNTTPGATPPKMTAAVYIKHQGVMEDPNNHLESKVKRLLAGSVTGLEYDNVAVISDRSRFTDIALTQNAELISPKDKAKEYVSIWSIVMTKASLGKFRAIFFLLICLILVFCAVLGWMVYKFYPELIKKSLQKISIKRTRPPKEEPK